MRKPIKFRKIIVELDPKYQDPLITKFIGKLMLKGKKETARNNVYKALEKLAKELNLEPPQIMREVVEKAAPILEVKSRRVGGANYQIPVEVKPKRKIILALKWLIEAARANKSAPICEVLYKEMKDIINNSGSVIKKREDTHKMAEANRAFAHFARY